MLELERCQDGVFPLITNELIASERDLLWAYKKQPQIKKRFSQMETDFVVAPVHLHSVSRIQAFLCVYFLSLLVEALLGRELRAAMKTAKLSSIPLDPEGRACKRPTTRRVIDVFDNIHRHRLKPEGQPSTVLVTQLSALQRTVLKLLGQAPDNYGR